MYRKSARSGLGFAVQGSLSDSVREREREVARERGKGEGEGDSGVIRGTKTKGRREGGVDTRRNHRSHAYREPIRGGSLGVGVAGLRPLGCLPVCSAPSTSDRCEPLPRPGVEENRSRGDRGERERASKRQIARGRECARVSFVFLRSVVPLRYRFALLPFRSIDSRPRTFRRLR